MTEMQCQPHPVAPYQQFEPAVLGTALSPFLDQRKYSSTPFGNNEQ